MIDQTALNAQLDERDERLYSHLLLRRFFQGYVTAVNLGSLPYLVQVRRVGDPQPDLAWHAVEAAGYVPGVGDRVQLVWLDQLVAAVVGLVAPMVPKLGWQLLAPIRILPDSLSSVVSFQNIPQAPFSHLKLVYQARSTNASDLVEANCTFNNDNTVNNYVTQRLDGHAAAASASETNTNQVAVRQWFVTGASTFANAAASGEIHVPYYRGPWIKNAHIDWCLIAAASGGFGQASTLWSGKTVGAWAQVAAVNRIDLSLAAGLWVANSRFGLYGI